MVPYVVALLFLFIAGFLIKNKFLGYMTIIYLLFLSMFRGRNVGSDTINYVDSHYYYLQFEIGEGLRSYEFINLMVSKLMPFFGNYVVVWFYSLALFVFLVLASKRFKVNVIYVFFFFVILVYFNMSLNIARQFTAVGIILYAYSFLTEESCKKFLFFPFVLIAAGIHSIAIFFIILFFLRKIEIAYINHVILVAIILVTFVFSLTLAQPFIDWANLYALSVDENLINYSSYFGQADDSNRSLIGIMVSYISLFFNIYILLRILKIETNESRIIALIFLIGMFVSIFFDNIYGNLGRVRYYLSIINVVAYAEYQMYERSKYKYVVLYSFIGFLGVLYIWNMADKGAYESVPYYLCF